MPPSNLFFSSYRAYGFGAGSYWSTMIADICEALDRKQCSCTPVESYDHKEFQEFLLKARLERRQFIATFNFITPFPHVGIGDNAVLVQELFAAQSVTIFLDHPIHEVESLVRFEAAARHHDYRPAPAAAPIYGVMEADHALVLNDLGVSSDRIFLFPQAGPKPVDDVLPLALRPHDLLFHGTIADLISDEEFYRQIGLTNPTIRMIAGAVLEATLSGTEDVYHASRRLFIQYGISNDVLELVGFARALSVRARLIRRWRLLSGLSDLKITYCGEIAESFRRANPNGIYLEPQSFGEVMKLAGLSKMVLNDTINLRDAALMRFHYCMGQGCLLASEANPWLKTAYGDGQDVVLLEPGQNHADVIRSVLSDLPRAQRIADQGRAKQAAQHQWDHRVDPMIKALAPMR